MQVRARLIFPNCPRYIHRLAEVERSEYVPHAGLEAPVPAWKRFEMFADVLPAGDPARSPSSKPNPVSDLGLLTDAQSAAAGRAVASDLAPTAPPAIIRAFPVGV